MYFFTKNTTMYFFSQIKQANKGTFPETIFVIEVIYSSVILFPDAVFFVSLNYAKRHCFNAYFYFLPSFLSSFLTISLLYTHQMPAKKMFVVCPSKINLLSCFVFFIEFLLKVFYILNLFRVKLISAEAQGRISFDYFIIYC